MCNIDFVSSRSDFASDCFGDHAAVSLSKFVCWNDDEILCLHDVHACLL
jgi:hypothetical protein